MWRSDEVLQEAVFVRKGRFHGHGEYGDLQPSLLAYAVCSGKASSNVAIGIVSVRSTGIANDHQASPIAGGNGRHQSSGIPPS